MALRVVVSGAGGKMGREVAKAIHTASDMELVGAADPSCAGADVGELAGVGSIGVRVAPTLAEALDASGATHVVDFTTPGAVFDNVMTALDRQRRVVFGTTGLSGEQLQAIDARARQQGVGVIHAPNFALGAVLMMRFAAEAARFFDSVEIIELHHDQKVDAPSGTAIKTAELIAQARQGRKEIAATAAAEVDSAARGEVWDGVRIHSVRLPGLVAHQEVILGLPGQTLTIRHDSLDRSSFMPGVLLALRRVDEFEGLVYGLERLLFEG